MAVFTRFSRGFHDDSSAFSRSSRLQRPHRPLPSSFVRGAASGFSPTLLLASLIGSLALSAGAARDAEAVPTPAVTSTAATAPAAVARTRGAPGKLVAPAGVRLKAIV